jgi:hypothetical protein
MFQTLKKWPLITRCSRRDVTRQHFVEIEQRMGIVPHVAVFASWVRFPRRAISDASGRGQDYLVNEYGQFRNARK